MKKVIGVVAVLSLGAVVSICFMKLKEKLEAEAELEEMREEGEK